MSKKKKDLTSFIEAGRQNLAEWKKRHPEGGNLRHGIFSRVVRQKKDKRTKEGRTLKTIIDAIQEDIGSELDARQNLILGVIRLKLIITLQITKYIETSPCLIDWESGKVPHIIEYTFPRYSASLIKLLDSLYSEDSIRSRKIPNYYDIVQSLKTNAAARPPSSDPEE